MANHIFFRDSQFFRDGVLRALWILRRGPDCDFAVFIGRKRDHRLHRSVSQKGNVVVRLIYLATFGERRIRVTNITHYFARIVRGRSQFVLVRLRVVVFVWSVVPCDVQLLAALKCRPGVVGNYRNASQRLKSRWGGERINCNRLLHARDLQRFFVVERFHLSTENRWVLH